MDEIKRRKKNSRLSMRPTLFFPTIRKKHAMINLGVLRVLEDLGEDLMVLILEISMSRTFSLLFLETWEDLVVGDDKLGMKAEKIYKERYIYRLRRVFLE
jgi:hypothetical protein